MSAALPAAFLQFPACLTSCDRVDLSEAMDKGEPISIVCTCTRGEMTSALDLFFYDTTGVQLLDSYQRLPLSEGKVYGVSGKGARRMVGLSAFEWAWDDVRCFEHLARHRFSLEDESPDAPLLVGDLLLRSDADLRSVTFTLQTMLCAITLRSIACDFSGRPYADKPFIWRQAFLTYAGAECLPLLLRADGGGTAGGDGGGTAGTGGLGTGSDGNGTAALSWINDGRLDSLACAALPHPEMLWQPGDGALSRDRSYPQKTFYCYPGAPTHLVLEGTVGDDTCYYPIPIPDLAPEHCVQMDLTLKRMGSSAPDIPAVSDAFILESQVLPWEEREGYSVSF